MKKYLVGLSLLLAVPYVHAESNECKSLDVVEFGLIGDGNIGAPWSEVQLIEKFGPPCQTIDLGMTFVARKDSSGKVVSGETSEKKQFVYSGDGVNKTTIITIVNGVVVKKERVYE